MFAIIFVMLGINMYWSAFIIDPILQIAENQHDLAKIAITQNERIIDILTNGTDNSTADLINKMTNE